MSELFVQDGNRIIFRRGEQTLWVEAHAPGILRVRRSVTPAMPDRSEALTGSGKTACEIKIEELSATMCTAGLQATIGKHGSLRFSRIGEAAPRSSWSSRGVISGRAAATRLR